MAKGNNAVQKIESHEKLCRIMQKRAAMCSNVQKLAEMSRNDQKYAEICRNCRVVAEICGSVQIRCRNVQIPADLLSGLRPPAVGFRGRVRILRAVGTAGSLPDVQNCAETCRNMQKCAETCRNVQKSADI